MVHSFNRASRLEGVLQHEVATMLLSEIKDPYVTGLVTLMKTEVSGDLRHATFYISVLGDIKAEQKAMKGIKRATGFIRTMLGKRLDIKKVPELHFKLDKSLDARAEIEGLLAGIHD